MRCLTISAPTLRCLAHADAHLHRARIIAAGVQGGKSGRMPEPGDRACRAFHMVLEGNGQFLACNTRLQRLRIEVGGD